jgi:AraC-like DNA-binding protein
MQSGGGAERIEWSQCPDLLSVGILLAENCARRWRVYHDTYTVCTGFDIAGESAEWNYRHKTHYQGAGGQMLMEPGEIHATTRATSSASFRVLFLEPSTIRSVAEELGIASSWPHFKFAQLSYHPALFPAFARLHRSIEQPSTTLERQSRFADCLRLLLENCSESPRPAPRWKSGHPAVRRARAFINDHATDKITLDDVVAAAGSISRYHLMHAFAAEVGLPPHAYQIQVRLAKARRLLSCGMSPGQVAFDLGFADQSHFTRHFHGRLGVTPAAFARANNGKSRK